MDWLLMIALNCAAEPNKAACEKTRRECVEWLATQPETEDYTKEELAVWIESNPKARAKICR